MLGKKVGYQIDHKNGNWLDAREENLRYALPDQNIWNQGLSKKNTSGYKGVVKTRHGKYRAQVKVRRKVIKLGTYALLQQRTKLIKSMVNYKGNNTDLCLRQHKVFAL